MDCNAASICLASVDWQDLTAIAYERSPNVSPLRYPPPCWIEARRYGVICRDGVRLPIINAVSHCGYVSRSLTVTSSARFRT